MEILKLTKKLLLFISGSFPIMIESFLVYLNWLNLCLQSLRFFGLKKYFSIKKKIAFKFNYLIVIKNYFFLSSYFIFTR